MAMLNNQMVNVLTHSHLDKVPVSGAIPNPSLPVARGIG